MQESGPLHETGLNPPPLPEAPGARVARVCGVLAIVTSLMCLLPLGLILGIVAIVRASTAKRMAESHPGHYSAPSAAGMTLGVIGTVLPAVMLPFIGIVSAIAFPALLAQRARAKETMVRQRVLTVAAQLTAKAEDLRPSPEAKVDPEVVIRAVRAEDEKALWKNPYTDQVSPLERGEHPTNLGQVSLWLGLQRGGIQDRPTPVIFVRGSYQRQQKEEKIFEKVVELE